MFHIKMRSGFLLIAHITDLAVSSVLRWQMLCMVGVLFGIVLGRKEGCSLSSCSETIPELSRFFPRDIAPLVLSRVSLLLLMVALASEFVRFSSLVSFPYICWTSFKFCP